MVVAMDLAGMMITRLWVVSSGRTAREDDAPFAGAAKRGFSRGSRLGSPLPVPADPDLVVDACHTGHASGHLADGVQRLTPKR
jgi:hypothetical protein